MKVSENIQKQMELPPDLYLAERRRAIAELVQAQGRATVAELRQRFGVSEVTIRADLQALAEQKLLVRTHGGAVATGSNAGESFVYLGCPAYSDGTPDLDNLIAHAFGYAYKLTGAAGYRTLGTALFNTAVSDGSAASAKHYDQQFRSSGHFPAYISAPAASLPTAPRNLRIVP